MFSALVLAGNVLAFVEGTESFGFRGPRASRLLDSDPSPNTRVEGSSATWHVPSLAAGSDVVFFCGSWLSVVRTGKAGVFFRKFFVTTEML